MQETSSPEDLGGFLEKIMHIALFIKYYICYVGYY